MKLLAKTVFVIVFAITMTGIGGCGTPSYVSAGVGIGSQQYINPPWAPPYVAGVRYYYLPDIEAYYDLSNQDFVYLDDGQWLFSRTLPSIYGGYDLYNGFAVALNFNVFQPWMHNQYYVSHYPRYYYRSKYNDNDQHRIRGFNENGARPFYRDQQEDRNRGNQVQNNNRAGANNRPNTRPETARPTATRPPQKVGYYGKEIGQPVKVQPHMRENAPRNNAPRGERPSREGGGQRRGR